MNRIVIIGNGFDLAHGLPSRFEDFILYLINKSIDDLNNRAENSTLFERLFILKRNPKVLINVQHFNSIQEIKENGKIFKTQNFQFLNNNFQDRELWTISHIFSITFNSKLFFELFAQKNWTDVEKGYFETLSTIFKNQNEQIYKFDDLKNLNSDFEELKKLFIEYISEINIKPNATDKT